MTGREELIFIILTIQGDGICLDHLMFYAQSTVEGQIGQRQNVLLPQVKFSFTVDDAFCCLWSPMSEKFGEKMNLNESGEDVPGRPLRGFFISASVVPDHGGYGDGRAQCII